jgi:hypothetical protein
MKSSKILVIVLSLLCSPLAMAMQAETNDLAEMYSKIQLQLLYRNFAMLLGVLMILTALFFYLREFKKKHKF